MAGLTAVFRDGFLERGWSLTFGVHPAAHAAWFRAGPWAVMRCPLCGSHVRAVGDPRPNRIPQLFSVGQVGATRHTSATDQEQRSGGGPFSWPLQAPRYSFLFSALTQRAQRQYGATRLPCAAASIDVARVRFKDAVGISNRKKESLPM